MSSFAPIVSTSSNEVEQILKTHSYNTIKDAMRRKYNIKICKVFTDITDNAQSMTLSAILTPNLAGKLQAALMSAVTTQKRNQFSAVTMVPEGEDVYTLHPQELEVENGVFNYSWGALGQEVQPMSVIARITTLSTKMSSQTSNVKQVGFDTNNNYGYNAVISDTSKQLMSSKSYEPNVEMMKSLQEFFQKDADTYKAVKETVESNIPTQRRGVMDKDGKPTLTRGGAKVTKEVPIMSLPAIKNKKKEPASRMSSPITVNCFTLYPRLMNRQLTVYFSGHGKSGIGIFNRDNYLGLPYRENGIQHITALYEAGVKRGDRVFVHTGDTHLIVLLRSQFGSRVWGRGNMYPMLRDKQWQYCDYDFVYIPAPVKVSIGSDIVGTYQETRDKLQQIRQLPIKGNLIMPVSPLVYCEAGCYQLLHGQAQMDLSDNFANVPEADYARTPVPRLAKKWEPIDDIENYGCLTAPEMKKEYPNALVDKLGRTIVDLQGVELLKFKTSIDVWANIPFDLPNITLISPKGLQTVEVRASLWMDSWTQTVMHNSRKYTYTVGAVYGMLMMYGMHINYGLWGVVPLLKATSYNVRKIGLDAAKQAQLDYSDEYQTIMSYSVQEAFGQPDENGNYDNERRLGNEEVEDPDDESEESEGEERVQEGLEEHVVNEDEEYVEAIVDVENVQPIPKKR